MNIAVIGLGLIGGSLCKTIKRHTNHICMGYDTDHNTLQDALGCGAIDQMITPSQLFQADLTIVSLHPIQTISFIREHANEWKEGSIVIDTCGVKESIIDGIGDCQ